jgi:2-polyprenyl-3-methyl-5-hydroxy-6-metoxy-1,4-benzoquinol methylase
VLTLFYTNMSSKFHQRSFQDELLDSPLVTEKLLVRNLRELDFLNRNSGGHRVTLEGIKMLMTDKLKEYHIVDLGCGSGDLLRVAATWASAKGYRVRLTGVDKHHGAIRYLQGESAGFPEISGTTADYRNFLKNSSGIDIIVCSLFCHHLNNKELLWLLEKMYSHSTAGFVINDLQRNRLAYYMALAMTRIFGGSELARHDGPVSVLRGFKADELHALFSEAGVKNYIIHRRPFFRLLAVGGKRLHNKKLR